MMSCDRTLLLPANADRVRKLGLIVRLVLFLLFGAIISQSYATQTPDVARAPSNDLSRRVETEMEARAAGDLAAIGRASSQVIALALAELANVRMREKAYDESISLCRESLKFEDVLETHLELAIASLFARRPSEALEFASAATERAPENVTAWAIKGEALLENKDYVGAAAALGRSLELKKSADSIYALGIAYLGEGEQQKAADAFSQLMVLAGDDGLSHVLVGRAYQDQNLPQEAEAEFSKALQINPRTPNAHYFWALTLLQSNAWSPTADVRQHLLQELEIDPHHFLANYWLGYFASKDRNYGESDRYLRLAAAANPSQPEVWMFLGLNAQSRAVNGPAEAYLRKAVKLTESHDPKEHFAIRRAYFALGRILVSSGREKEGQGFLQKARELELQVMSESQKKPAVTNAKSEAGTSGAAKTEISDSEILDSLSAISGQALIGENTSGLAQRALSNSRQFPAGDAEKHLRAILGSAFNDLATSEALQEKYALADTHYREAERWDSRIPGLQRNLGLSAFFVGKQAEAIPLLAKAVTEQPGDSHARAVLGLAYFATQDFARAAQTIAPMADRAVQDPQLGYAWAKSLAETRNKRAAASVLQRLDGPGANLTVENFVQFAKLWQELGEPERAAQLFRRALIVDPANADAKCALHLSECR
jgi:tetratricopeptide (TPR) repeat protein